MPETNIGYAPDVGSNYVLARVDGEIGTYLALTANTLTGEETFRLGLATHFVESSRIPQLLERLAGLENPDKAQVNSAIEEFSDDVAASLGAKDGASSIITGPIRGALDYAFAPSRISAHSLPVLDATPLAARDTMLTGQKRKEPPAGSLSRASSAKRQKVSMAAHPVDLSE